ILAARPYATIEGARCFKMQTKSTTSPVPAAPADETEQQLIERAKTEPAAFAVLYERYVDRIYAYIFYRTGDAREAEDLTARVFYRALAHMPEFNQRGAPFAAWLYRIAHNLLANWRRDRGRHPELPLDDLLGLHARDLSPLVQAENAEDQRALLEAMRRLPPERQQLLILKFVDDLSNVEIGQILGRSEGAIKSLYHRTLLSLREELVKQGMDR
ncbi:MAG: sigma-70 family RNA polymerase sigma factor, partial [Rudaea sp.]